MRALRVDHKTIRNEEQQLAPCERSSRMHQTLQARKGVDLSDPRLSVYLTNAIRDYSEGVQRADLKLLHRRFHQVRKQTAITMISNEVRIYFANRNVAGCRLRIVFRVDPADGFAQDGFVVSKLLQETDLPAGR